jgi:hypothetical protein
MRMLTCMPWNMCGYPCRVFVALRLSSGYCAPESLSASDAGYLVHASTDVYMLGCLMYEIITHRVPYHWISSAFVRSYRLDGLTAEGLGECLYTMAVRLGRYAP